MTESSEHQINDQYKQFLLIIDNAKKNGLSEIRIATATRDDGNHYKLCRAAICLLRKNGVRIRTYADELSKTWTATKLQECK